jgi:hypothetical protein
MSRKKDPVGLMVGYFSDEPLEAVRFAHKALGAILASREAKAVPPKVVAPAPARRGRGPNKPKVVPTTGTSTSNGLGGLSASLPAPRSPSVQGPGW